MVVSFLFVINKKYLTCLSMEMEIEVLEMLTVDREVMLIEISDQNK